MKEINLYNILSYSNNASINFTDTEIINKYINDYCKQHLITESNKNISFILRYWSQNKKELFKLLGNRFIYEFPIEIPANFEQKKQVMEIALNNYNGYNLKKEFKEKYLLNKEYEELFSSVFEAYHASNLIKNVWNYGNFSYGNLKITNGMKITTAFKKISNFFNCKEYESFRLAQSKGCNLNNVEGIMCLSIHPLDFFTLADNNCHWDTCLSWKKEGGSCLGTIELMNNSTAVIAYLKSKDDMTIPGGKWNSKKWRELFFVNKDFLIEGKSYPYRHDDLTNIVIKKILSLINYKKLNKCELINNENVIINKKSYTFNSSQSFMYNDFKWIGACAEFNERRGHYAYFSDEYLNLLQDSNLFFNFSGPAICISCGKDIISKDVKGQASNLCCPDCAKVHKQCKCCGNKCFNNSLFLLDITDEEYCEDCYLTEFSNDDIDLQVWSKKYIARIFITDDGVSPQDEYICYTDILDPISKYNKQRKYDLKLYFKNLHLCSSLNIDNFIGHSYYVYKSELGKYGKKLIGLTN